MIKNKLHPRLQPLAGLANTTIGALSLPLQQEQLNLTAGLGFPAVETGRTNLGIVKHQNGFGLKELGEILEGSAVGHRSRRTVENQ